MSRPIPCDKYAERAVLGKLFYCRDRLPDIAMQLQERDFYFGKHRSVWGAMVGLLSNNISIDLPSVWKWIDDRGNQHGLTIGSLATLGDECTAADLDAQVALIKQLSALRTLIEVVDRIGEQARHPQDDVSGFLSRSLEQVIDATSMSVSGEPVLIRVGIGEMIKQAMDPQPARSVRLPTGISEIDNKTGGLLNEQLNMLVARPSMGKTTLVASIAMSLCRIGPVLWFSLEETVQQIQFILTSMLSGVPYHDMQMGRQCDPGITRAAADVAQLPIHIERQRMSVDAMVQKSMAFKGRHQNISGIIIDHAALIPYTGKSSGFRAQYEIFNSLSGMAGRVGCPLLVAHQLNRSIESRPIDDRRPRMSDLRDAGEEPAKMIIGLYRDCVYNSESSEHEMEAIVLKNKGPIGTAYLDIDITCARIFNREANYE